MEVKPITIVAQPGGKPVSAGHFCTIRLSKPNKQGAITVEIVPSRRVAKKVARTSGRYLLSQPPAEKVDSSQISPHNHGDRKLGVAGR